MNGLLIDVKKLKNKTYQKIMFRLINIFEEECSCNEGNLSLNDLLIIYNLFYFLENGGNDLEGGVTC